MGGRYRTRGPPLRTSASDQLPKQPLTYCKPHLCKPPRFTRPREARLQQGDRCGRVDFNMWRCPCSSVRALLRQTMRSLPSVNGSALVIHSRTPTDTHYVHTRVHTDLVSSFVCLCLTSLQSRIPYPLTSTTLMKTFIKGRGC